jgi:CubicO group peptidase (beta-lactamase class C family)
MIQSLHEMVATEAAREFSGAVRVTMEGSTALSMAFGEADRSAHVPNAVDTRFGIASGTKFVTALAAGTLIEDGLLALDDRLVDLVPLPGLSPDVTIDHLLTHTSGVYDYLDEDVIDDAEQFKLPIPPSELLGPRDYLPMLFAGPAKFAPGTRFSYSNGGYVLLGIALEEVAGRSFHELVEERVLKRCGMRDSGFFRFDRLPPNVATGYVEGGNTNVETLPIIGGPDGGMFATVADIERLWRGVLDHRVIGPSLVDSFLGKAVHAREQTFYGRGVWIQDDPPLHYIVGQDAGVSFRSSLRADGTIATVVSNTSRGAWPMVRAIEGWIRSRP